jgi:hypothetical protein
MQNDNYYNRSEVSNSDLTELKRQLYPSTEYGDKEKAFRFGSLVDALITEPHRVRFDRREVDGEVYSGEDWNLAAEMKKALRMAARTDAFLRHVLEAAATQRVSVRKEQPFEYGAFEYSLDTRCKWDWWLSELGFGGDLKTTAAATDSQFREAIDYFDWDRSRAWYMDVAGSKHDFVYAISKKNCKVFKMAITRDDAVYRRGKEKYEELAFRYWMLVC